MEDQSIHIDAANSLACSLLAWQLARLLCLLATELTA